MKSETIRIPQVRTKITEALEQLKDDLSVAEDTLEAMQFLAEEATSAKKKLANDTRYKINTRQRSMMKNGFLPEFGKRAAARVDAKLDGEHLQVGENDFDPSRPCFFHFS